MDFRTLNMPGPINLNQNIAPKVDATGNFLAGMAGGRQLRLDREAGEAEQRRQNALQEYMANPGMENVNSLMIDAPQQFGQAYKVEADKMAQQQAEAEKGRQSMARMMYEIELGPEDQRSQKYDAIRAQAEQNGEQWPEEYNPQFMRQRLAQIGTDKQVEGLYGGGSTPADLLAFNGLSDIAGLSPEDKVTAARIKMRLDSPAPTGGVKVMKLGDRNVLIDNNGTYVGEAPVGVAPDTVVQNGQIINLPSRSGGGMNLPSGGEQKAPPLPNGAWQTDTNGLPNVQTQSNTPSPGGVTSPNGVSVEELPLSRKESRLPDALVKDESADMGDIASFSSLDADLGALRDQIEKGNLNLSVVGNATNAAKNKLGVGDDESAGYSSFIATLKRLQNESLRLNKGVQTEGDAIRVWEELIKNTADKKGVTRRLQEIQRINQRAAKIREDVINARRKNYNLPNADLDNVKNQESSIIDMGSSETDAKTKALFDKYGIPD